MNEITMLLRQINPSWIQEGRVTSQTFRPTSTDEKLLSVYDGDKIAAEDSWRHFTIELGLVSIGVMAATVAECQSHALTVTPDPEPYPEHVVIDYSGFSEKQIKSKAKFLTAAAVSRGWQYRT